MQSSANFINYPCKFYFLMSWAFNQRIICENPLTRSGLMSELSGKSKSTYSGSRPENSGSQLWNPAFCLKLWNIVFWKVRKFQHDPPQQEIFHEMYTHLTYQSVILIGFRCSTVSRDNNRKINKLRYCSSTVLDVRLYKITTTFWTINTYLSFLN